MKKPKESSRKTQVFSSGVFLKYLFDSAYVSWVNSQNVQAFIVQMIFYCNKRRCSKSTETLKNKAFENIWNRVNMRARKTRR